jgi:signal peptidase I
MKYFFSALCIAVLLSFVWRYYFDIYRVTNHSMHPTLLDGDKVLVKKRAGTDIARESIVLFNQAGSVYIKRCIGMPGEKLEIRAGKVVINDSAVDTAFTSSVPDTAINQIILAFYGHTWSNDNFGPVVIPKAGLTIDLNGNSTAIYSEAIQQETGISESNEWARFLADNRQYTFKKDYFFMLGDNRHHSEDSRTFGYIERGNIVGVMQRVLFSSAH